MWIELVLFLHVFVCNIHCNHVITVQRWMTGKYNNSQQVQHELSSGRNSREDGGHEKINCVIRKHLQYENVLVSSFYFENESQPYRYRYYECFPDSTGKYDCVMKLYKPTAKATAHLQRTGYSFKDSLLPLEEFEALEGCEVGWRRQKFLGLFDLKKYVGVLIKGECSIVSERDPSMRLFIKDELLLKCDELWINDQVRNWKRELIIGNKLGIPYRLNKLEE